MNISRNEVTRRISLKTETGKVQVWENARGEVLELHHVGGRLEDIISVRVSFDQCIQALVAKGAIPLVSRQAIEESQFATAA
ncbi:hypothetical protein L4Z68_002334 [Pseudomonas aeruginosa]|uniref:hypothetical protein n=1 Tax=Aquipseudomonas alcaligenes TaxID=43263 RepID=UPI001F334E97|nr:hypothetical protein [Pseudomonas alcaligenes]EKU6308740.1 hypothetical protein [Pseudomonas aeruginosa]EKX2970318.1 hypothetical protein [Pseudomonas aeruginosa]BDC78511.1 hypothetical protein MRCP2_p2460 [Pseudomonas alcaligenes]HBO6962554.1 hypothetical protein [Pseudomonas aeruginosa]HBO7218219.1 hypothetical protein [Pseudomonas aeruginosa]